MSMLNGFLLGETMRQNESISQQNRALQQWIDYAKKLEVALKEQQEATFGQAGIKAAALKEIARVDPNNPLLQQEVREDIYGRAVEEAKKSGAFD